MQEDIGREVNGVEATIADSRVCGTKGPLLLLPRDAHHDADPPSDARPS